MSLQDVMTRLRLRASVRSTTTIIKRNEQILARVHSPRFVFTYDARLYIELLQRPMFFVTASPLSKSWCRHSTRSLTRACTFSQYVHSCHYVDCCTMYTYSYYVYPPCPLYTGHHHRHPPSAVVHDLNVCIVVPKRVDNFFFGGGEGCWCMRILRNLSYWIIQ